VHPTLLIPFRHLLVHDAASGGHPLDVACAEAALVAEAVAVIDGARQDIGDRLDAAMRVPRESGEIVGRVVVAEIVEEQERIEVGRIAEPKPRCSRTPAPSSVGFG
jgi:hypothetical protein